MKRSLPARLKLGSVFLRSNGNSKNKESRAVAGQVFQEIVRELGKSSEIIHQLQQNLGLPENASFYQTITNSKLRAAIDGVIDQIMVESIAEKLNLPPEEVESRLIALSVDIALLPEKVLTAIGRKLRWQIFPIL